MKLKIKSTAATAIVSVDPGVSVRELSELVASTDAFADTSIVSYKYGFPPKTISATDSQTLQDAGIKPNEQLIAETGLEKPAAAKTASSAPSAAARSDSGIPHVALANGFLILRNVPDDNSCLFHAISYALTGSTDYEQLELRHVVASTIRQNPDLYSEVVLGRPNAQYCAWIEKKESWGGAIELGILSKHLNVRINCFDVELGNMMVFQDEAHKADRFIVLVYSGIHYDCIVSNRELTSNRSNDVGCWTTNESEIDGASEKLVQHLQHNNYTTNTTTFRVRCLECYEVLVGEMGAQKHANSTGHFRFGEVK